MMLKPRQEERAYDNLSSQGYVLSTQGHFRKNTKWQSNFKPEGERAF